MSYFVNFVFCVFSFFLFSELYSWNINFESLENKCRLASPEWMKKQITCDLAPFSNSGVTQEMLEETWEEVPNVQGGEIAYLVRVRIKNGMFDVERKLKLSDDAEKHLENFLAALQILQKIASLPDLDCLVSLADHYDRPLFLRFTKAPVFTACKALANHRSILFPSGLWDPRRSEVFERVKTASSMYEWEKRKEVAFWRGSLSEGIYPYFDWDFKPRSKLMFFSKYHPDLVDAGTIENDYFEAMNYVWKMWMMENYFLRDYVSPEMQLKHRYLIAIDSIAAPCSLQWQLFSGSTVLKAASVQFEWFYADLIPYVHYVPFRQDSVDLGEKVMWLRDHPEEALEIAKNAQVFAEERLSDESVFHYTYLLLKEYATLLNPEL